ncbi:MAG: hypothetical protein P4N24_12080 [Acidobacteriota bacterium]|nr:hypothetical protein [Acidobacteriota bacterium]
MADSPFYFLSLQHTENPIVLQVAPGEVQWGGVREHDVSARQRPHPLG